MNVVSINQTLVRAIGLLEQQEIDGVAGVVAEGEKKQNNLWMP